MNHPMIQYWNEAFIQFKVAENSYHSEEMPDPILSPHFVTEIDREVLNQRDSFNLIIPYEEKEAPKIKGFRARNDFYLGTNKVLKINADFNFHISHLETAKENPEHKAMLLNGFPQDYNFLLKLEPFLTKLNAKYKVGHIIDEKTQQRAATLTMGMAKDYAVIISGMVHTDFRDQRLSRKIKSLVHIMAHQEGIKEVFYWTKSERLIRYADKVHRYLVYVRH